MSFGLFFKVNSFKVAANIVLSSESQQKKYILVLKMSFGLNFLFLALFNGSPKKLLGPDCL